MRGMLVMLTVAMFLALCGVGMLVAAVYRPIGTGPDLVMGGMLCLIAAMLSGMAAVTILVWEEVRHPDEHEADEMPDM